MLRRFTDDGAIGEAGVTDPFIAVDFIAFKHPATGFRLTWAKTSPRWRPFDNYLRRKAFLHFTVNAIMGNGRLPQAAWQACYWGISSPLLPRRYRDPAFMASITAMRILACAAQRNSSRWDLQNRLSRTASPTSRSGSLFRSRARWRARQTTSGGHRANCSS